MNYGAAMRFDIDRSPPQWVSPPKLDSRSTTKTSPPKLDSRKRVPSVPLRLPDRHYPSDWFWRGDHSMLTAEQMSPPDVKVLVVRAKFLVGGGKLAVVGEFVTMPAQDAACLEAAGHVERISE